ncbi:serine hydrolase domain-containing protein [Permianibacter aggregans]|uniref:CubicO group peptidase (Beta-lactamase class C family) n=1 Tax=Permianibacter aggregans TaxID=1510150 RepID=A0A4R6V4I2_9GAMM|nr:serine hydrolase domain-containing protein [Permianibacter aggregans]QGX41272.1 class A beta-lactamase-related serine hydrolase [Permianibacter aggregans]TDQ51054.1 CubicO group peptidase (beta-lactamase class C family) [Permianibacter aggregans]
MKQRLFLASALCMGLLAATAVNADALQAPAAIQKQIPALMEKSKVRGLAIAKIENGKLAWHAAFGERAPGKPMQTDSVFNVASLTKPVFATAALHAIADQQLQLDESLASYWVDEDIADDPRHQKLTARTVLSHQSGLPNWRGNRKLAFMFEPGQRHEYSGEGFEYLRRALERKTDQSMTELMNKQVLQVAGMTQTYVGWNAKIADRIATGFNEAGEPIDTNLASRQPNAAAHLMSTVDDYARFLAWVANGAGLPAELQKQMAKPQALHSNPAERFGLGWKLIPLSEGEALMHDGREPGVRTYAMVSPQLNEGLVILTNSSNGELIFRPLIAEAMSNGEAILRSTDQLVWHYLQSLPPQALAPMSRGIARSPSYLSTLLHAVNTALMQSSALSDAEKRAAAEQVNDYVFARFNDQVSAEQAQALIERLLRKDGDEQRLHIQFNKQAAREWLQALQQI